jgi:hypothetical protein
MLLKEDYGALEQKGKPSWRPDRWRNREEIARYKQWETDKETER